MSILYDMMRPVLFSMEAEKAHNLSIRALKLGLLPHVSNQIDPILRTELFGLTFPNPIGLAAGYDKNAEVLKEVSNLGFGFVEAGSVTPRPQAGNPKPRIFRLVRDEAVINRLGFNNQGLELAAKNFSGRDKAGIAGANLGANKDSDDRIEDYVLGMRKLAPLASYVTVNISSPNTPGLRALQGKGELEDLLGRLMDTRKNIVTEGATFFPILLKIAPDLTDQDKSDIAETVMAQGIDGLIISNTTITRLNTLLDPRKNEPGGLSGQPLKDISLSVLKDMYRATRGQLPLIGVGGIQSAEDAYRRIRAGASLLQLYTAMIYKGPYVAAHIARGLVQKLRADNFTSVKEAVGVDTPLSD
ncbi:MAG: quinone-dependent dihydroorotate dehydrogenase [Sneathiella sp.]|nr:quinone-dependent dihydroorotate dehydrogenase [Sneathiella sp.]